MLQLIVPMFALHLHASTVELGLIRSASGIGMILLVLPAGFLTDHYGWKKLYIIGGIISSLLLFLMPYLTLPILLIYLMGLQGISNSLKFSSLNAAFFQNLRTIGLRKAGWYRGSMSIGLTFIGPLAAGYLLEISSFRILFMVVGLLTLFPALVLLWRAGKGQRQAPASSPIHLKEQFADFKQLLRNSTITTTVLTETLSTACFSTFAAFIAVLVSQVYLMPLSYASWFIIMEGAAFILTVFLSGRLLDRFERRHLYMAACMMTVAGLLLMSLFRHWFVVSLGTIAVGYGLGTINLMTFSQVGEFKGPKGKISGLLSFCIGLGAALGPAVGGIIGQAFGIRAILLAFVPLFTFAGFYMLLRQQKRSERTLSSVVSIENSIVPQPEPVRLD